MKRFIIFVVALVALIASAMFYYRSVKFVDDKVGLQIQSLNTQVEQFEERYTLAKTSGDTYLTDIVNTCLMNKPTDNFRELYVPQKQTHDGGEIDFLYAIENDMYWDDYQLYCIDYAKAHDIRVSDIAENIGLFEQKYEGYDKTSPDWFMLLDTMPFYENYYNFKFYNYQIEHVSYFATMYNDYITQLIEIKGMNNISMTIELLWYNGKIIHVVRRL